MTMNTDGKGPVQADSIAAAAGVFSEKPGLPGSTRQYRDLFDNAIAATLLAGIRLIAGSPSLALRGAAILRNQRKAAGIRKQYEKEGIMIPAVMMISLTSRCNLSCKGCYQRAQHRATAPEMDAGQLGSIISQAEELGVSVIVFAGGEPLMRKDEILALAKSHPALLFAVFTNGLLIDEDLAGRIANTRNIVPMLSFEGFRQETDLRRGGGVFDRLLATCSLLKEKGIFFGCSVTVTRINCSRVLDAAFTESMLAAGSRAFAFVEYVPVEPGTEDLVVTPEQRSALNRCLAGFSDTYPAIFIGFPGNEAIYGGCLASGRGFIHVSPSGDLEPCPAAPFSDANLTQMPLKEALRSGLLEKIRMEHGRLTETDGGCALWTNRNWVLGLLGKTVKP